MPPPPPFPPYPGPGVIGPTGPQGVQGIQGVPGPMGPTLSLIHISDETLGSLAANENGGVNITVTAKDGTAKTYTFTDVALDAWYAQAVDYLSLIHI